jgi:hypothetical protein
MRAGQWGKVRACKLLVPLQRAGLAAGRKLQGAQAARAPISVLHPRRIVPSAMDRKSPKASYPLRQRSASC